MSDKVHYQIIRRRVMRLQSIIVSLLHCIQNERDMSFMIYMIVTYIALPPCVGDKVRFVKDLQKLRNNTEWVIVKACYNNRNAPKYNANDPHISMKWFYVAVDTNGNVRTFRLTDMIGFIKYQGHQQNVRKKFLRRWTPIMHAESTVIDSTVVESAIKKSNEKLDSGAIYDCRLCMCALFKHCPNGCHGHNRGRKIAAGLCSKCLDDKICRSFNNELYNWSYYQRCNLLLNGVIYKRENGRWGIK